jgi:excisionase family DNA binding protein
VELLTTSDAARIIGVGTTSVKRWADTGLLNCIRTAGGHRRFTRDSLDRFIRLQSQDEPVVNEVTRWIDILLSEMSHELALIRARARLGSWCRVAEELDPVLVELGLRWAHGQLSIAEEHIVTERLSRSIARITESLPLLPNPPVCLLAAVESEEHRLGLHLAELCLRESGWMSIWLGACTPTEAITERVRLDRRIQLVGLSASEACLDPSLLRRVDASVGDVCRERNVALMLGGRGPWPDVPSYGVRVSGFDGFEDLRRQLLKKNNKRAVL